MRNIPRPYEKYRHFKGNLYQIIAVAKSSEDESRHVVYQALYGDFEIYVRPLEMFLSEVDTEKYPKATQKYRFEIVEKEKTEAATRKETVPEAACLEDSEILSREGDLDADEVLDPLLLQFLDSDTYEAKLNILSMLHGRITQDMINTIAMALDIEIEPGEIEERYEQVKTRLMMLEKFECNRLR